jgi:8-oxo-dGTP pyrophosphatase MutT (NUDIX family)
MAAVRETYEETGFILGQRPPQRPRSANPGWRAFFSTGYAPDLAPLRYFARAITPPGMARRFDARFFIASASALSNPDAPLLLPAGELLDTRWLTLDETRHLDLPRITRRILDLVRDGLDEGPDALFSPRRPVFFQYRIGQTWRFETI